MEYLLWGIAIAVILFIYNIDTTLNNLASLSTYDSDLESIIGKNKFISICIVISITYYLMRRFRVNDDDEPDYYDQF